MIDRLNFAVKALVNTRELTFVLAGRAVV